MSDEREKKRKHENICKKEYVKILYQSFCNTLVWKNSNTVRTVHNAAQGITQLSYLFMDSK